MNSLSSIFLKPQAPPKAELQKALKSYGLRNPSRAWKEFSAFAQNPFDRAAWMEILPIMLMEFSKAPDPDLAVVQFSTYAERSFHRTQLFQYLLQVPQARQVLAQVFGLSPSLASTLFQQPTLLYWLFDEDGLYAKFNPARFLENLEREVAAADDQESRLNALRRVKRRQMLRLGARDLMGLTDVKDLTYELSGLADGLLEMVIRIGREKLGPAPPGSFTVMGMGKLGGQELNYNSDIDLLFVYCADEKYKEKAHRYFNDLAEWVIQAMEEPTSLGNLFKVDMRLRPEGLGDMAKSLDSYLEHYENRSQPWELQALIKARPCGGDLDLGRRFLKEVEPLIYRKVFDASILGEMRGIMNLIKEKMETKGRGRTQVKLGRGGIREIEFIVQLLQLVHGGRKPEVRQANTLDALQHLGKGSILLRADTQFLADAYRFLRNVEHHLQMVHGLQTHTLPSKADDLERLARSLGFKDEGPLKASHRFKTYYGEITTRVHNLYNEIFKIKDRRDSSAQVVQDSLTRDKEGLLKDLEKGFFADPALAATNLEALAFRLQRSAGAKGEMLWTAFVPELFKGLKKVPNPDRALNHMENFLKATSLPDLYVRYLMENPTLLKLLLELFSNSVFLSQILTLHPGNFDIVVSAVNEKEPQSVQDFIETLEDRLEETPDWEEKLNLLREVRDGEILRVGLQDLLGKRELFDCFAELSRLAISISRSALGAATEKMKLPRVGERPAVPKGFCLFAMGKLGAREMNYGSDIDLLFIYGDEEAKETGFETYLKLAETFTQALSAPTTHGVAYKIDARLRPMGREAQMVHSVEAYRQYFRTYAQVAERLAYTRAVFLAGDRKVGFEAKEEIEKFTYGQGLTRAQLNEIYDIRGQMEEKAQKAEGIELKLSPGGIVDIEFFVQVLQVAYGQDHSLLRMPHVPTVMGYIKEEKIVPNEILDELLEAYRFFRLLEARHRMVHESSDDELPVEPERLLRLAWRMGLGRGKPAVDEMLERIHRSQVKVRAIFKLLPEWVRFSD